MDIEPSSNGHASNNGRTAKGTFSKGNSFGRGGSIAHARMWQLRLAMLAATPPDRLKAITERLVAAAEGGDLEATKILLSYVVGKPPASVMLSGPEGEPLGVNLNQIRAVVVAALRPYGSEAQIAVAAALKEAAGGPPD